ncbi:MAG: hypothetical protein OSJ67_07525, partial [Clostridia bacterium]|nr:hypothetical protein [Clostridia bacterium]
ALHTEIMANGNMMAECAVVMARKLKEMRDSKLYETAGFATFGEYAETACGIKERQAYNYISIVENLSGEFLQSSAKIGVSKLSLLASMDEGDRADLISEHGEKLDEMTVKEMDKLKRDYENRIQQLQMSFDEEKSELEKALKDAENERQEQLKENAELEEELENLKNKPIEVKATAETAELAKKKEEINALKEEKIKLLADLKVEKKEAEKRLKEEQLKQKQAFDEAVRKEREEIERLQKTLENERAERNEQEKKRVIASDPLLTEFKARFNLFQKIGGEMVEYIEGMAPDNAEKCKRAINTVIERWKI